MTLTQTKYSFYIGLQDSRGKRYDIDSVIRVLLKVGISNASITLGVGMYNKQAENSVIVTVIEKGSIMNEVKAHYFVEHIKKDLRQECVLVTKERVHTELI